MPHPTSHDLVLAILATLSFPPPEQSTGDLTARMLTAPNALAGPSPSSFKVNSIEALEANDKLFDFIPMPNQGHSFRGDGLVAALLASTDYLAGCLGNPRSIVFTSRQEE